MARKKVVKKGKPAKKKVGQPKKKPVKAKKKVKKKPAPKKEFPLKKYRTHKGKRGSAKQWKAQAKKVRRKAKEQPPREENFMAAKNLSWNDIFQHGTLIAMHRHKWQARIRITPEDLGIEDSGEVKEALSLGSVVAAPHEAFKAINAAITSWETTIEDHSLSFPILEAVRYVPDNQVQELQRKLDLKYRDFRIAVEEFLDGYEKTMHEQLPKIEQALQHAAKSPEAAAEAMSRVIREYPSRQKIAEKFGLEWQFFTITMPVSDAAAQSAKSAVPQVQQAIQSMIENLRTEMNDKVSTLITLANKAKDGTSRTKDGFGNRSIESAIKVLDKVDRLNFFGDPVLTQQTRMLRTLLTEDELDLNSAVKNLNTIQKSLESDIAEATKAAEERLTSVGRRKLSL